MKLYKLFLISILFLVSVGAVSAADDCCYAYNYNDYNHTYHYNTSVYMTSTASSGGHYPPHNCTQCKWFNKCCNPYARDGVLVYCGHNNYTCNGTWNLDASVCDNFTWYNSSVKNTTDTPAKYTSYSDLQKRVEELTAENSKLKTANNQLKNITLGLIHENKDLKEDYNSLLDDYGDLEKQYKYLGEELIGEIRQIYNLHE